jgi:SAM-dependent methyltransferase
MKHKYIDWSSSRALTHKALHLALSRILPRYSRGIVVDLGCGDKPYREYIKAKKYIGVDKQGGDLTADVLHTPFKNNYADTVISTQVLEHVTNPQQLFKESYRILKKNGYLILTAPMNWPVHDVSEDYWRFTEFGLVHLAKKTGFKVIDCQPLDGFISVVWQTLAMLIERPTYHHGVFRTILKLIIKPLFRLIQPLIYWLDRLKPIKGLTMNNLLIAQKNEII